jgi:hypothetical protein
VAASTAGAAAVAPAAGAAQTQPGTSAAAAAAGGGGSAAGDTGDPHLPHKLRPNSLSGPQGWASLRRSSATSVGGLRPSHTEQQQQQGGIQQQEEGVWSEQAAAAAAGAGVDAAQLMLTAGDLQRDLQEVRQIQSQ